MSPALILLAVAGSAPAVPPRDLLDFVYLDEGRPALVRLHVAIDGKPYQDAWDDFQKKLFAFLDRDGNGSLAKDEAARVPSANILVATLQGNSYFFNPGGQQPITPLTDLDTDKNGTVSPAELSAYYVKNGLRPLPIRAAPGRGDSEALTEALFRQVDVNKDGKLSKDEIKAAPDRLRRLDADDDEAISVVELVPERFSQVNQVLETTDLTLYPEGQSLVRISPDESGDRLARALLARYDRDRSGSLERAEVNLDGAVFDALDANRDGKLPLAELTAFARRDPDLEVSARIGSSAPGKSPGGALKLFLQAASSGERQTPLAVFNPGGKPRPLEGRVEKQGDGTLKLTLPGSEVALLPTRTARNPSSAIKTYYLQQFKAADRDKKGFLERKAIENNEYQYFASFFALADRDGDAKLTEKELTAYLDLVEAGTEAFVSLTVHDHGRGLVEILDVVRDGRLGCREVRTAWTRLAPLDRDGDGAIAKDEVPRQFHLVLRQGQLNYPYNFEPIAAGYRTMSMLAPQTTQGPSWFRKMDRNGDGDLSPREWLGPEEGFRRLDLDGDGLLSATEAGKVVK